MSLIVAITVKKARLILLCLGCIPVLATYAIEPFSYKQNLDHDDKVFISVGSELARVVEEENLKTYQKNGVFIIVLLVSSMSILLLCNFCIRKSKQKLPVRVMTFLLVVLFLLPFYGDKHHNMHLEKLHSHFIWQAAGSYVHIH